MKQNLLAKIKYLTFSIFLLQCLFFCTQSALAKAQPAPESEVKIKEIKLTPTIELEPGKTAKIPWIGEYLEGLYKYLLSIIGILAATIIVIAGAIRAKSSGDSGEINESNAWVIAAISGVIIALMGVMLFNLINPDIGLKDIEIFIPEPKGDYIPDISSCSWKDNCAPGENDYENLCKEEDKPGEDVTGIKQMCCCQVTADIVVRDQLKAAGVRIHCSAAGFESLDQYQCACMPGQGNCTGLALRPNTTKEILDLQNMTQTNCIGDERNVIVTGGSETGPHVSRGPGSHPEGWKFDAQPSACLDKLIKDNCEKDDTPRGGKYAGERYYCDWNNDGNKAEYVRETKPPHWDTKVGY